MTIELSKYGSHLYDLEVARQLAPQLLTADPPKLNFQGVTEMDQAFFEELFGELIRQKRMRGVRGVLEVSTLNEKLKKFVLEGLRQLDVLAAKISPSGPRPTQVLEPQPPEELPPPTLEVKERYTPTRLFQRLSDKLKKYLQSAYPLKDPQLIEARHSLLEQPLVVAQEPYLETTPRYASGKQFRDLDLPLEIRDWLHELTDGERYAKPDGKALLYDPPYAHQGEALERFLTHRKDLIVATGTGSGKTECFLLPILASLGRQAQQGPSPFSVRAVRALILYPMNALVNDQVSRLRLLFGNDAVGQRLTKMGGRPIQFAMYTSRTPYPGMRNEDKDKYRLRPLIENYLEGRLSKRESELRGKGRWPAKDLRAYYGQKGKPWKDRLKTQTEDRELLSRHEVQETPPDLLVTNYSMLEYMLMRPIERGIFDKTRQWLAASPENQFILVLDEAHMYRGARGAEVGLLIRRLLARLGLENRPDKVRVICTSASLGTNPDAPSKVRRFCADLTGKHPDDFTFITGARQTIEATEQRTEHLPDWLDSISLADLHNPEISLAKSAKFLFDGLGLPGENPEAELYERLKTLPETGELLRRTSGQAVALSQVAEGLFPNFARARYATEVLLTLGTLARPASDEPGLIPARIHLFFRGLPGLYACINQNCPGRLKTDQPSTAGKLFLESRSHCDACGCRVLDLASCRECGSTYFLARVLDPNAPEFLWDYAHQVGVEVELLGEEPNNPDKVEEIRVDLKTGYLNPHGACAGDSRSLWFGYHTEKGRETEFSSCPVCLSQARRPVLDMATKGEQSFTALVETLFAEQPPQMAPTLGFPNAGRKVLCFSDGRQKAARLAPALEQSHMRDTFRQLLALASRRVCQELNLEPTLNRVYFAVLKIIAERRLALSEELHQDTVLQKDLGTARDLTLKKLISALDENHRAPEYAYLLYAEACDRYYSLAPLGLGYFVESTKVWTHLEQLPMPDVGWDRDTLRIWLRIWIRIQLERECFRPLGVSLFNVFQKTEAHPNGIEIPKDGQWMPPKMHSLLVSLAFGEDEINALKDWLKEEVTRSGLLTSENNKYYLDESCLSLHLAAEEPWHICQRCSRLHRFFLEFTCPDCRGSLQALDKLDPSALSRRAYFMEQVQKALNAEGIEPFGLFSAEHSAQLTSASDPEDVSKVEEYELRFQDILLEDNQPPVDVLSCTTTMEVGIDIGTLSAVALRNVPPHVSNYQQRAGRAGRRGRGVAGVVTYAHGGSHDSYFFQSPDRIISGEVQPPVVYIENKEISKRHARAFVMQTFFHETVTGNANPNLFATLGTIRSFLGSGECTLDAFEVWLELHRPRIRQRLLSWLPVRSHWMQEDILEDVRVSIADDATLQLPTQIRQSLPVQAFEKYDSLDQEARERLDLVLDQPLLQTLIDRAIFPRYAFPTDIVSFHVFAPRQPKQAPKYLYQPQRDLRIALSEYAPSAELTVDKYRYQVRALYSPFQSSPSEPLEQQHYFLSCVENQHGCGFVSVSTDPPTITNCPVCEGKIQVAGFLRPQGFAPDVNVKAKIDKGGSTQFTGQASRSRLEVPLEENPSAWTPGPVTSMQTQHLPAALISINRGQQNRGFLMCSLCGCVDMVEGPGYIRGVLQMGGGKKKNSSHSNPINQGMTCPGDIRGPFFLGHRFVSEVLAIRANLTPPLSYDTRRPALQSALITLSECLLLAACRILQIDEGEMEATWSPVQPKLGRCVDLCLYDVLPGGAGFARASQERLSEILAQTQALLDANACNCQSSCYRCLRHFGNRFYHAQLDRKLAHSLLDYFLNGTIPSLTLSEELQAAETLASALRLHGFHVDTRVTVDTISGPITVPLVVQSNGSPMWILPYHRELTKEFLDPPDIVFLGKGGPGQWRTLTEFSKGWPKSWMLGAAQIHLPNLSRRRSGQMQRKSQSAPAFGPSPRLFGWITANSRG